LRIGLISRFTVGLLALAGAVAGALAGQVPDSLAAARRIVAATSLAAKEYGLGVAPAGRRVVLPEEVGEAKLFLEQARFDVAVLPAAVRAHADTELVALRALVERLAPPADVERRAAALARRIGDAVGGPLDPPPSRPPSLARGARVYGEQCAACHGDAGLGDGPKAATLEGPAPANLADPAVMAATPPVEVFRRVTIGVPGTAMPEFESTLSEDDRWAVSAYALTLWLQANGGRHPGYAPAVFASVRRQVDSAVALRSDRLAFDAYLTFEQVETDVRARNAALAARLEAEFADLRTAAPTATELGALRGRLLADLERAERLVADRPSATTLAVQSFVLLVREGFEAILILGALLAFLTRAGAPERRRDVVRGAWLAVAASGATWLLVELVFRITPGQREALEGVTMLLAVAVLFYVSYWLLSKVEADRWNAFVRGRMERALAAGSGLALASVAFLAVYREGFETILFYQALLVSAGGVGAGAVAGGAAAGAVALAGVYLAIMRLGLRVPLKPFFAGTGVLLYLMAFAFAGRGVAELQEAGLVATTVVTWAPRLPVLGIYPTLETLAVQALLVGLLVAALGVLAPRSAPISTAGSR
jgi:high-affinity iron transporter